MVRTQLVVDCRGLFDSIVAEKIGKILDRSMHIWISAVREVYNRGWLDEACWIPTESMIVDSQTKWKDGVDSGWLRYYRTGEWRPDHLARFEADFLLG